MRRMLWVGLVGLVGCDAVELPELPELPELSDYTASTPTPRRTVSAEALEPEPTPARPTPTPVALDPTPDLSGPWIARGLLPFLMPALYATERTERTRAGPSTWRFRTEITLQTSDRVRVVGEGRIRGVTQFRGGQACTSDLEVELELQPWVGELPLQEDTIEALSEKGQHRVGCVDVVAMSADELVTVQDDLRWTERRERRR